MAAGMWLRAGRIGGAGWWARCSSVVPCGELAGAAGMCTYYVLVGLIEEDGVVGLPDMSVEHAAGGIARRTGILAVVGCLELGLRGISGGPPMMMRACPACPRHTPATAHRP